MERRCRATVRFSGRTYHPPWMIWLAVPGRSVGQARAPGSWGIAVIECGNGWNTAFRERTMAEAGGRHKFDHVVSVMFENRTFDNLLGRLYQPGEVPSFEGVIGKDLSNPIPEWAGHGADRKVVPYGAGANMTTPNPDSGEASTHINTPPC